MNEHDKEKRFIDNVKKALDLGAENLDAGTQSKLTRIRHKALDAGERKGFDIRQWFTLPVAGWASACLIVLGLAIYMNQPNGTLPPRWRISTCWRRRTTWNFMTVWNSTPGWLRKK